MAYVKVAAPSEVYHLTKRENLNSILDDGMIRRFDDTECWFCENLPKMKAYMEQTVLCEGKPYYAVGGRLCRYPKFMPEEHVLLRMIPCENSGNWYRWEQEVPPGSSYALVKAAREFSELKIGYRGDLPFRNAEVIDVPQFLLDGTVRRRPVQNSAELWEELRQRIERSHQGYTDNLYRMSPAQLISSAAEIEASRVCYNLLLTTRLDRTQMETLLTMDDPLESMRDAWASSQTVGQDEEFSHVLFEVCTSMEQAQTMQMK